VKCDEEHPECFRCTKFGRICEGYGKASRANVLRPLAPSSALPLLLDHPLWLKSGTEVESRYFETFCSKTSLEVFQGLDTGRLRVIFLQACELEPSIRHAAIALGALDKTSEAAASSQITTVDSSQKAAEHYRNSLVQYAQAIETAQYAIAQGKQNVRVMLMNCLILTAFEAWRGDRGLAVEQIKVGLKIIKEWKEFYGTPHKVCVSSAAPAMIEDDLVHAFRRLSISVYSSDASVTAASNASIMSVVETMPPEFTTREEVWKYANCVLSLVVNFAAKGQPAAKSEAHFINDSWKPIDKAVSTEIHIEREDVLGTCQRWLKAIAPFNRRFKGGKNDRASTGILELQ